MQFTHLAGRKPIANYEADVMPHVGFSGGGGNSAKLVGDGRVSSYLVIDSLGRMRDRESDTDSSGA